MHKIYTTYFAKLKKLNIENAAKALIMRMPPAAFFNEEDIIHCPQLSPSSDILIKYKKDGDFDSFTKSFKEMLENDEDMKKYINYIIEVIESDEGNDVCLICCEKDRNVCHRSILADYIKSITSCEVIEL